MQEKFLFQIASNLVIYLINLLVTYFLILKLSVKYFGFFNFAFSLVALFMLFLDLGFSQIYQQYNAKKNFEYYFSIYFFYKMILIICNFIPLFIIILFLNLEPIIFEFSLLLLISNIFNSFSNIWETHLGSKLKIFKKSTVMLTINILKIILTLFIISNTDVSSTILINLGYLYIILSIINLVIILFLSKGEYQFKRIKKELLISFIKDTKPLMLSTVLSVVIGNIGKIILYISLGTEALAYYSFVQTIIVDFLMTISSQVILLLSLYLPTKFKNKNIREIENITHILEKYSSILFLSIIILVLFNGKLMIELFLPKYKDSLIYIYILIFIPYLAGINRPYTAHLISSKRQKLASIYSIFRNITEIFLILIIVPSNFFFINTFGLGGIGLASIKLSGWIIDVFFFRYFSFKIGISSNKRIFFHIIYAFIAFICTSIISNIILIKIIPLNSIFILISSIILIGIFFIELLVSNEINLTDLKFFLSLLNYSNIKNSFIDEMKPFDNIND